MLFFICTATSGLLREIERDSDAALGDLVWKLNAVSYLAAVVITAVGIYSAVGDGLLNAVSGTVNLAAGTAYVYFLFKSHTALLAP